METVKNILENKGNKIVSVGPDATLAEALKVMADDNVGAVLVIDKKSKIAGIFSERDFARKSITEGRTVAITKVSEIMTPQVLYVKPDTSISDCMNLMTEKRIRHLPVLANGKLMGVISIGDVVKALLKVQDTVISEQEVQIGMLNNFITGSP
ncbi:MAG: CBS domain-containing protein [Rectinemataceae bacterium]|jgi:CBS domain-containing protein